MFEPNKFGGVGKNLRFFAREDIQIAIDDIARTSVRGGPCIPYTDPTHAYAWPTPAHPRREAAVPRYSARVGHKWGGSATHRGLLVHLCPCDLGVLLLHHLVELAEIDRLLFDECLRQLV